MSRDERRMEERTRRRRLKLLDRLKTRSQAIAKVVGLLERDFEGEELERAESLLVDLLTFSGIYQQEDVDTDHAATVYGLEPADVMLLHELLQEAEPDLTRETEESTSPQQ